MPVHFKVAPHDANEIKNFRPLESADKLLAATWGVNAKTTRSAELLQTSYGDVSNVAAKGNGFVPDDVWMAILSQFNFYINAHAEELRHKFVQHEGQKKLIVKEVGTRYSVDFGALAIRMTELIDQNALGLPIPVVDKDLKDWILPDFTTTTINDTIACAVYMMSTLKAYFSYGMVLMCGIPSVTLEGEKQDWEKLLSRIDKLKEFGTEPEVWVSLLRPILTRFVNAFDGQPDVQFWDTVCHYQHRGSGETTLSGWITAFCVWDSKVQWCGPPLPGNSESQREKKFILDDVEYGTIGAGDVPCGYCEVDVELDDNGAQFNCMMVSGHLTLKTEREKRDTVRPYPGWFMFIKESCEDEIREMMAQFD